eukprot:g10602.t1
MCCDKPGDASPTTARKKCFQESRRRFLVLEQQFVLQFLVAEQLVTQLECAAPGPAAPGHFAAYKKKALEHHPDRGGDADKFKDISKAYDVLGSPDKKKMYDLYGDAGLEQMEQAGAGAGGGGPQGFGHHDPFDMFRDIFGQNFQGGQQHPHANRRRKTQDIVQKMKLSLEEIYRGTTKDYQLTRHVLCEYCGGHGGSEVRACSTCGGSGRIEQQQRMGPFVQFVQSECPKCNGEGMVVPPGKQCKPCRGKGITEKKEFFQIQVPRTATTGFVQKFEGKADEVLNCETGDLIFVVEEQRHPVYHRIGQDLMIKKTLPLQDALCGFRFKLRFLDEREIIVESAPGQVVKPNDIWRIPGKGMPTSNGTYGDLVVRFEVLFPSALASEKSDQGTRNTLAKLGLDKSFYFAGEVDGDEGGGEKGSGAGNGDRKNDRRVNRAEPMSRQSREQLLERVQRQKERGGGGQGSGGDTQCQMM